MPLSYTYRLSDRFRWSCSSHYDQIVLVKSWDCQPQATGLLPNIEPFLSSFELLIYQVYLAQFLLSFSSLIIILLFFCYWNLSFLILYSFIKYYYQISVYYPIITYFFSELNSGCRHMMALMWWLRASPLKSNFLSLNSFSITLGELFNCCKLQLPNM